MFLNKDYSLDMCVTFPKCQRNKFVGDNPVPGSLLGQSPDPRPRFRPGPQPGSIRQKFFQTLMLVN